jgi:RNA polymerase sigma factor (sigma-70 family)
MMTDDEQLLLQYARERSESAFGELVARHMDFVYSTALRVVNGDSHLAQDVAQTVFIDLARKAGSVPGGVGLAGWLHRHTCYTVTKAVRTEQRRQSREQTAMEMRALDDNTRPEWEQVAPYLDESLNQLNPADREALVLRFLKQQDLRAVGEAVGISEEAARKRVDRALEKLHVLLKQRGATLSAAALGTALATEAVTAAPAGLAATITTAALAGTAITTTAVIAATKAIAMTTLQKTVITAALTAAVGTGVYEVSQATQFKRLEAENADLRTQLSQVASLQDTNGYLAERLKGAAETSQANQNELLRLRGQAVRLRQLEQENAQLKSQRQQLDRKMQQSQAAVASSEQRPTAVSEVVKATADNPPHRDATDLGSLELQSGVAVHFDLGGGCCFGKCA